MSVVINGDTGISGVNGHAGAPALKGSDADTGVHFGTNTASISTGGTNRLHVDANGNCGIGTAAPADRLHISNGAFAGVIVQSGRTAAGLGLGSLLFRDGASNNAAEVLAEGGGNLIFKTSGSSHLTIDDSGHVGINTTDPQMRLDIVGTDANFVQLRHVSRPGSFKIEHSGVSSENLRVVQNNGSDDKTIVNMGRTFFELYNDGVCDFKRDSGVFIAQHNGNYFLSKPQLLGSFTPSSSISAGTFFNIIAAGTLDSGLFIVEVTITAPGPPYHHTAAATFYPSSKNSASANSNVTEGGIQHSHIGGSYLMEFRETNGSSHVRAGVDLKLNYNLTTNMTAHHRAYRLGH